MLKNMAAFCKECRQLHRVEGLVTSESDVAAVNMVWDVLRLRCCAQCSLQKERLTTGTMQCTGLGRYFYTRAVCMMMLVAGLIMCTYQQITLYSYCCGKNKMSKQIHRPFAGDKER